MQASVAAAVIALVALGVVVGVMLWSQPEAAPPSGATEPREVDDITVVGELELRADWSILVGDKCYPVIPDQDLHEEIAPLLDEPQVRILDAADTIVGTATVEWTTNSAGNACLIRFETTVPAGGEYYTATVASLTSDVVAESDAQDGVITLDLGDNLSL